MCLLFNVRLRVPATLSSAAGRDQLIVTLLVASCSVRLPGHVVGVLHSFNLNGMFTKDSQEVFSCGVTSEDSVGQERSIN